MIYFCVAAALVLAVVLFDVLAPGRAARFWIGLERRRARLVLKRLTIAGLNMPYLEGGRGEALVLVHGFGGDKDNFTRLAGFLTCKYRVIIPDLPGFGDAGRDPTASYGVADQVERLLEFLAALGLDRVHLGGNSMGGFIAAECAARHPQRVASLWLLDAAGTAAAHDTPMLQHYEASGEMPLLLRSTADVGALFKAIAAKPLFLTYSVKTVLARRAVSDYPLHARIMAQLFHQSSPLESRFKTIAAPALIVWGTEDKVLNPRGASALHALLPNSRVVLMSGVGHVPMLEAPRNTAEEYLRFRAAAADPEPAGGGSRPRLPGARGRRQGR